MVNTNSLFDLRNKVALVTGASSGLGRRAAIVLSAAGAKVIGVARRRDALEELRKEIGNSFSFVVGDVAQRDKIKNLLSEASKEFGMPDILVHAAGLNPRQTANEVTSEGWDKTLEINLSALPLVEYLSSVVVSQQLSTKAAKTIWSRVHPIINAHTNYQNLETELHSAGLSKSKANYVIGLINNLKLSSLQRSDLKELSNIEFEKKRAIWKQPYVIVTFSTY